jgi:hypothetical protein
MMRPLSSRGQVPRPCSFANRLRRARFRLTLTGLGLLWVVAPVSANVPVDPGIDLLVTPPGTFIDFSPTPIPADFFDPGSDPFTGTVNLLGQPFPQIPPADTIVERLQTANVTCGTSDTIDIELVALSLTSVQPITVTFNGGSTPEMWDVQVCVSSAVPSTGTMTINHECPEGGTFSSVLSVVPKFVFTRLSDGALRVLDPGDTKRFTADGFWVHDPMGLPVLTSPGVQVDGDCDGALDAVLPGTSNFFAGIQQLPCNSCTPMTELPAKILTPTPHVAPNSEHGVEIAQGVPPGVPAIPTLSALGLAGIVLLLSVAGAWALYRRRKTAPRR